jgi:hypothetical protein
MKVAAWVFIVLLVLFTLFFGVIFAHGSTHPRPNSVGVNQFYENNNSYMFALPIAGTVMDGATSIRFQPYNTMSLYEESVLFCGDVSNSFRGKSGPIVVTYDRVAHRMYRGVACHDIVSVFEVHADQVTVLP